jgi:Domain of unknown function (DUF3482)/Protein of unknown function (DUF2868)
MERSSTMEEVQARRVVLAQAIEIADTSGVVVRPVERTRVDDDIRAEAARSAAAGQPWSVEQLLAGRAQHLLRALEARHTMLASLQAPRSWLRWLGHAAPWLAFSLGVLTDRIGNPHQVDLLSLPLLGLVLWNLAVYVLMAASVFGAWPTLTRPAVVWPLDGFRQWRGRSGKVHAEIVAGFYLRWNTIAASLNAQRIRRVLHACAALWGAGVAMSLFTRGLVVEYRVGWESTFLDANQVHAILRVLFAPVVVLFSHVSFSVEEVARLRFGTTGGELGGAAAGARWVYMYAGLLLLVVVLPRLALAAAALRRERVMARAVPLDLQQPYFQQVIAALRPAHVRLCIFADRAQDQGALLRVLVRNADTSQAATPAKATEVIPAMTAMATDGGDVLDVVTLPIDWQSAFAAPRAGTAATWMQRTWGRVRGVTEEQPQSGQPALDAVRAQGDVVLRVVRSVGELQDSLPLLQWLLRPALVLLRLPGADTARQEQVLSQCRTELHQAGFAGAQALAFDEFARCWIQEPVLLDAIGRAVVPAKQQGYARLCKLWHERSEARLRAAMTALANHLMVAAREREEVLSAPLSLKSLVRAGDRDSATDPRRAAMVAVAERLRLSDAEATASLLSVHGLDKGAAENLDHELEEKFTVREGVSSSRAGMAGAASGAAMGASVDLLTGGLTLGAAAAVGALAMGSAAFLAAAWRNKSTHTDATVVQLSDEMLQALVEAGLLRYLAVALHSGNDEESNGSAPELFWRSEVVATVEMQRDALARFWAQARAAGAGAAPAPVAPPLALVELLQGMARRVLGNLHTVVSRSSSV